MLIGIVVVGVVLLAGAILIRTCRQADVAASRIERRLDVVAPTGKNAWDPNGR